MQKKQTMLKPKAKKLKALRAHPLVCTCMHRMHRMHKGGAAHCVHMQHVALKKALRRPILSEQCSGPLSTFNLCSRSTTLQLANPQCSDSEWIRAR